MALKVGQLGEDDFGCNPKPHAPLRPQLFGDVGELLHRRGYCPFPVRPSSKIPAVRGWNKQGSDARVAKWRSAFAACNVGIASGPSSCVGIDIDLDDPKLANHVQSAACEHLGRNHLTRHRGNARRLLLYGALESITTQHFAGCDVIGAGAQFVAYGMHTSGLPYQWVGPGPCEVDRDDLQVVTAEGIGALNFELAKLLGKRRLTKRTVDGSVNHSPAHPSSHQAVIGPEKSGLILDGRDAELSRCVWHVWATGETDAETVAQLAWAVFNSRVDLQRGKRDGPTPWSFDDAYEKASYLLRSGKIRPKPGHLATPAGGSQLPAHIHLFNKAVSEICSLSGLSRSADRISRVMAGLSSHSGICFATAATLALWLDINEDTVTKQRSCLVKNGLWSREYDASQVGALARFRPQIFHTLDMAARVVAQATRKSSVVVGDDVSFDTVEDQIIRNHDVGFEFLAGSVGDVS